MSNQFPLKLAFNRQPAFSNYIRGSNAIAIESLRHFMNEQGPAFLYLWGAKDCGKSHLLMAACTSHAGQSFYLPLRETGTLSTAVLNGLERYPLICLDDLEAVAGRSDWEEALFHLYNRIRENGGHLVVTATSAPRDLGINLDDLKSRLMWGACYQLQELDDADKQTLLIQLAREHGMRLEEDAAGYLIKRCSRETGRLVTIIDELDQFSLARKQRLTIPLLREWMGG